MAPAEVLALPWRLFPISVSGGELTMRGMPVVIGERANSSQGTGHAVWDGSIVLAKFLERRGLTRGDAVLELGAGTGLVGICAAVLGAGRVVVSDLEYAMDNMSVNITRNAPLFPEGTTCEACVLDWTAPPVDCGAGFNVVVMADVVWLEGLVKPLVDTIARIARAPPGGRDVFLAHQTRSHNVDRLFFDQLRARGLQCAPVPADQYHAEFHHAAITVYSITLQ